MEIPKAYEPQSVESKWYQFWLDHRCFVADPARVSGKRPAYSIVIPPPNVTGVLHMGHVLNNTIQDILSRKARMDGREVLWLPGTDHAGIATEGMVAKQIWKEEKKSKRDIGRDEFIRRVWAWKEKHGGIIIAQLKKLGCSCDWTRERFTMDPDYVRNVQRVFVDLYKKGLIYRGKRMVNWCPATQTALSDEEVEMKPQKGLMYHFKVEVVDSASAAAPLTGTPATPDVKRGARSTTPGAGMLPGPDGKIWLTIATTRPETIPGDTAVAVNPKDPRYAHLIGKHIVRPLPPELPRDQKLIPIVGDEHVDFEFGTGVLKVTPAHDKADFEIGQRHKLPLVDIMNPDGTMNELAGADLKGLDRFKARKVAEEKLTELGALVETKPYENNVGFSQRANVMIEPRLSEQWFLKYPSVEKSKACVEQEEGSARVSRADSGVAPESSSDQFELEGRASGGTPDAARGTRALPNRMRFHPQRWAKVYDHWLTNIQDWCISRQLWWGHRIPVWSITCEGKQTTDVFHVLDQCLSDTLEDLLVDKGDESAIRITNAETGVLIRPNVKEFNHGLNGIRVHVQVASVNEKNITSLNGNGFTQDPDVLDTWFSSWLWPFATMGWPEQTETLKKFYPTNDLVTAPEIIFFWVARIIMAGFEYMGELPFRNVYFTGIIRDKIGRKMSKTLGNSPDPLDLIAKYGADAVRFGTMRSAPLGQDVMFDEKDVELGRNFCNKLWNACRFRQMQGSAPASGASEDASSEQFPIQGEIEPALLTSDDKWILLKLDRAIREIDAAFAEYKFNEVTQTLYRFFWSEYCDWYVEASKAVLGTSAAANVEGGARSTAPEAGALPSRANKLAVVDFVLSHTLRLLHPFLPFITEELWHGMGYSRDMPGSQGGETIMFAHWPKALDDDFKAHYGLTEGVAKFVDAKYELVTRGRNLRREFNIAANRKVKFVLKVKDPLPAHEADVLRLLLNADALDVDPNFAPKKGTPSVLTDLGELFLPLEGLVDIEAERARLKKERAKIEGEIEKAQAKLNNPAFTEKAPANVLEEHRKRLVEWQAKLRQMKAALDALG